MEYTELADYTLPSGQLSTWQFISDASQWSEDERSLSINHEDHLREVLRVEKPLPIRDYPPCRRTGSVERS